MEELFKFIALIVMSHLFIGCSIVALIGGLLQFLSPNAATRHNIWLGLLVILLLMPLVTFLSPRAIDEPLTPQSMEAVLTPGTATGQLTLAVETSPPVEQINREAGITRLFSESAPVRLLATTYSFLKNIVAAALNVLPLYGLGVAFTLIIGFGIALKLFLFIRSYRNLRELFATSESVGDDWLPRVAVLAAQIGVRTSPALKCSTEINTPSTSGVFNPWIVMPTALLEAKKSTQSMEQILLHELAHIKRCDPLIASLQALISIFMFWHPAVYYVNKKIRFERELACDDWVISHSERGEAAQVRSYANSLLEIAESLQGKVSIEHSVACVHTSHGLVNRIECMLDRNADHSTSVKRTLSVAITFSALTLLIASLPSWPQLPSMYIENIEQKIAADYVVSDNLEVVGQESPRLTGDNKLSVGFEDSQQAKIEVSQLPVELGKLAVEPDDSQQVKTDGAQVIGEPRNLLAESEDLQLARTENSQQFTEDDETPVEPRQAGRAKVTEFSSQSVESIPASNELALTSDPVENLVPLVNSEPETNVDELGEDLQNNSIPKPGFYSIEQVLSAETAAGSVAGISQHSGESDRELEPTLAPQQLKPVSATGQSRPVIAANSANQEEASLESVIIIDDLSRSELRKEILKIQNEFYRVFNASTEEERLKVRCERRLFPGSHIKKRICEPQFMIDARNNNMLYWLGGNKISLTSEDSRVDKTSEFERLAEAMSMGMKENRYLLELNNVLRMLRTRFEELA